MSFSNGERWIHAIVHTLTGLDRTRMYWKIVWLTKDDEAGDESFKSLVLKTAKLEVDCTIIYCFTDVDALRQLRQ